MSTTLANVDELSDDGAGEPSKKPTPSGRQAKRPGRGFVRKVAKVDTSADPQKLRQLINSKCGCSSQCFRPWRVGWHLWDKWVSLRQRFIQMTKLEKDQHVRDLGLSLPVSFPLSQHQPLKVYSLMKQQSEQACRGSRHLVFGGHSICHRGFAKLMGIGKGRFERMRRALAENAEDPPFDLRYVKTGPKTPSPAWFSVHGYLTKLYNEAAESIPDGLNSNKRPRHGVNKIDPPTMNREGIKHLPHGSINDYWMQCVAALPGVKISKKLFTSVLGIKTLFCTKIVFSKHNRRVVVLRGSLRYGNVTSVTNSGSASGVITASVANVSSIG